MKNNQIDGSSADASEKLTADAGSSRRRNFLLFGGVAVAAAGVGGVMAWMKFQPHTMADGALAEFWGLSFDTPDGGQLAAQSLRGRPLLINFWATWCPPCIDELPLVDAFSRQHAANGWQTVGLAIDQPSAVRNWLKKMPLSFPVGLAGMGGTDLVKKLGNEAGGLPFTVVVDSAGQVAARKIGKLEPDDLAGYVNKVK